MSFSEREKSAYQDVFSAIFRGNREHIDELTSEIGTSRVRLGQLLLLCEQLREDQDRIPVAVQQQSVEVLKTLLANCEMLIAVQVLDWGYNYLWSFGFCNCVVCQLAMVLQTVDLLSREWKLRELCWGSLLEITQQSSNGTLLHAMEFQIPPWMSKQEMPKWANDPGVTVRLG